MDPGTRTVPTVYTSWLRVTFHYIEFIIQMNVIKKMPSDG